MEPDRDKCHRPSAFDKMEGLVREMQDPENGVPVRSQKLFLTSIPSCFLGYDLIEWLMERLGVEESEALSLAHQLCQYGYLFPVNDSKNLVVKDDSSLYRFQSPYYWPWQNRPPDNVEYAIYLAKRTLRNKQRHGLEEYEMEALGNLRKNLANKWDFITMQAEEQVKLAKMLKKGDKIVSDSQERAYWRVHRPPPGINSSMEQCPVPTRCRNGNRQRKRTIVDCKREVELLQKSLGRTRVKVSQALEGMVQHVETYAEYDPLISGTQPSNPWVSEDLSFWQINSPLVEAPTEKRVKRWSLSMEELVSDPTGLQEFTAYLRKEYSHENIRFWMAVNDLRRSSHSQIQRKVLEIFDEFLAPGAPCEINIDGKTMEKVHQEMKTPSRFTFDAAQDHVYTLLLKKDCYPRFIRSDHYKTLLAAGIQPSTKKRFFGFGPTKKKTSTSSTPNQSLLQQQTSQGGASGSGSASGGAANPGTLTKRRGSDRSLSGSAHELAVSGVRDNRVPHSHSQSNLSDIPYRGDMPSCHHQGPVSTYRPAGALLVKVVGPMAASAVKKPNIAIAAAASTSEDVCPWESSPSVSQQQPNVPSSSMGPSVAVASTSSRKNSMHQLDSGSSSSEISVAVVSEVSDRLRRSCGLTQQNTLDADSGIHKLTAKSAVLCEPRRASVCVPIPSELAARRTIYTFEDAANPASSAKVPSVSVVVPQCSVTVQEPIEDKIYTTTNTSCSHQEGTSPPSVVASVSILVVNTPTISVSGVTDETNNTATVISEQPILSPTSTIKSQQLPTINEPSPEAEPSTSAQCTADSVGDDPAASVEPGSEPDCTTATSTTNPVLCCSSPTSSGASVPAALPPQQSPSFHQLQLAPLAEPDSESPNSEFPPSPPDLGMGAAEEPAVLAHPSTTIGEGAVSPNAEGDTSSKKDGNETKGGHSSDSTDKSKEQNSAEATVKDSDVCPWEDEETCKLDAPFRKTYATLGFL